MKRESERSLWWQTAAPPPPTTRIERDLSVQVAIVGGGFTGVTAALHLAAVGRSVAVLEAEQIGAGASGLNGGFVVPNFSKVDPAMTVRRLGEAKGRALLALVARGGDRVFETARAYTIDCDAEQTGWLQPAHSEAADKAARARVDFWQSTGRPVTHLSGADVARMSGISDYRGALFDRSGGTIQPLSYLRGLARAAINRGATIAEQSRVTSAERRGGAWRLTCGAHSVTAEKVLLCTNAADTGSARRLARTIVPLNVYQIATEPLAAETARRISPDRIPMSDMRANLFTYRLDRDDRLISGGMAIVPIGAHNRLAQAIVARLAEKLGLERTPRVDFVWRGTAAMTPDFLPHLYEFAPGFIGAIGCNGRGIAMTAMLGEVLADAASGVPLGDLPVPTASTRAIPLRSLAGLVTSAALMQARWQDFRSGNA
jgi:glycine/D-amino acid oxidase-like deaminating enzyme